MSNPDDLDDGLLYDNDLDYNNNEDAIDISNIDEPTEASKETDKLSKKRERNDGSESESESELEKKHVDNDESKVSKRQKKLKNSKLHQKKQEQLEYDIKQRKDIAKAGGEKIVEFFSTLIRKANPDLSALELGELYFKKEDFLCSAKFEDERNLTNFPKFMDNFSKSPKAIVLSMSNIRVADVTRSLNFGNNSKCIKLFSKNKLKDDISSIEAILGEGAKTKRSKNVKYFIVTPTRMEKLLENTDLFFKGKDKLDIILDASYLDNKKNSILTSENSAILCKVLKTILKNKSSVKVILY
ncbi:hypothetical protein TBLA_0C03600 [Henningerozyma blattae CBS 6284]|uniref:Protein CMS1 n=1 Tax=Henningerozyma blattae (strain ATCC 34711 / CBS 6284 / DSM 70876 / NBRC 10599 / NRRL Y-10934 / UCD 77-7) TaxID=1071380 RepID=I2H1B0_HENB6|nr:hypothetical protein TBLA_0C03600 [Tetrapisispora blattae CBS 6284]CCH60162.1 hypothetical protein TBLA_0C03600 [Tetrapisispora blattae CBS 6284]